MEKFPLIVFETANSINLISFPDELVHFNELQQHNGSDNSQFIFSLFFLFYFFVDLVFRVFVS